MKGSGLKSLFLVAAILVALYCAHRGDDLDRQAHNLSEEIAKTRSNYVGDAASNTADKIVKPIEQDRDDLVKRSDEMNHLFTYMISGFLGLSISVASDLLGLARAPGKDAPPQDKP